MALYKTLSVNPPVRWMLMSPATPWEAVKIAFYLWRYPDRCAVLVGIDEKWLKANTAMSAPLKDGETSSSAETKDTSGVSRPDINGPLFGPHSGQQLPIGAA